MRGMGSAAIALPFLESMTPALAAPTKSPVRLAFLYVPNGIMMKDWNPEVDYEGKFREFPRALKPLEGFRDDILQLGNLTHNSGRALLDGAGDHGRCSGSYLTGIQVKKTTIDIRASISCDQIIANKIGSQTRFPSLELGMDDARQAGDCDSGYSCAYTNNLAWRSETQPLPPTLDPRVFFERLFGDGAILSPEERVRQAKDRQSILDFVTSDTKKLESSLGPTDKRKLDEYLSSIREVERQLEKAEKDNAQINPGMDKPYGVPADFAEHFKLLTDMMTIAFQSDMTRFMTFRWSRARVLHAPIVRSGFRTGITLARITRGRPDLIEKGFADQRISHEAAGRFPREAQGVEGGRFQPARQLDDHLWRRPLGWQPPSA